MNIFLTKGERFYLGKDFFIIKKGVIKLHYLFESGKILNNECFLKEDEVIGNYFLLDDNNQYFNFEIEVEIEVLEDTILEKINVLQFEVFNSAAVKSCFFTLIKHLTKNFLQNILNSEKYILAIFKMNSNSSGEIPKTLIKFEHFNISKSNFYLIYNRLKEKKYFKERENKIILNMKKIDSKFQKLEVS